MCRLERVRSGSPLIITARQLFSREAMAQWLAAGDPTELVPV
jgi:hypothetical protein